MARRRSERGIAELALEAGSVREDHIRLTKWSQGRVCRGKGRAPRLRIDGHETPQARHRGQLEICGMSTNRYPGALD